MTAFYCKEEKHQGKHLSNSFFLYHQTSVRCLVNALWTEWSLLMGGGGAAFYLIPLNKLFLHLALFFYEILFQRI